MNLFTLLPRAICNSSFFWLLFFCPLLTAQNPTFSSFSIQDLEYYLENLEDNLQVDQVTLLEDIYYYHQHRVLLNQDDITPLVTVGLISDFQKQALEKYLYQIGPLISIYELQAVPSFDKATISRLLPFVHLDKTLDDTHLPLTKMLSKADKTLLLRWNRILEAKRGFQSLNAAPSKYVGNPDKFYLRYQQVYSNKLSLGITAEKDAGEPFFRGINKKGFDFYSAHFFLKNINAQLSRLVIGDFSAHFGQGLILNTGFQRGKGALVTSIKQTGPSLNRYTAVGESNFFRGAGISWNFSKQLQLTGFTSFRKIDATLKQEGTESHFTALQLSGFHRTILEHTKKKTVQQFTSGWQLKRSFPSGNVAFNTLFNHYNSPYLPSDQVYKQFRFRGKQLWNSSLDYSYHFRQLHFFGETALSSNGQLATVNGVMSSLHPDLKIALHWRNLPKAFHALFGQAFMETSGNQNEKGLYLGLDYQPNQNWQWVNYIDTWQHPWLRYLVDDPSSGLEYYSRLTYRQKRKLATYAHFKQEYKQQTYKVTDRSQTDLLTKVKTNFRLHLSYHLNTALETRSRLEFSFFKLTNATDPQKPIFYAQEWQPLSDTKRKGFLIYQDLLYKPIGQPLSFTTRFAYFNTDNYDARIYAYENDLLYQFSIPAYYNKGCRLYLNFRYQLQQLTLEARYDQTYWFDRDTVGSGWEKIEGPKRSGVKVQMRYRL